MFDECSENEVKVGVGTHPAAVVAWRAAGLGLTGGRLEGGIDGLWAGTGMDQTVSVRGSNGPGS